MPSRAVRVVVSLKMPGPSHSKPSSNVESNALLFAVLWALSFLVHQLKHAPWSASISPELAVVRILMVISAIAVIWRPRDARLFVSMVAMQLMSVLIQLPGMSNCWMFSGIVGTGILAAAIRVKRQPVPFSTISIYEEVVPFLRIALITFYSLAALAKYNQDFLNPLSLIHI